MTKPKTTEHPTKIECCDCAKLPRSPDSLHGMRGGAGSEWRPASPRKIDPRSTESHKASPRCTTHWLAWRNGQRAKGAAARSRKRSGLDEERRQELLAFQGGVCAGCGRGPGKKRNELAADHCHETARQHPELHPEDVACELCMRGFLCSRDNREILGLLFAARQGQREPTTDEVATILENLAAYLRDWPMRRMLREGPRSTISDLEETG